MDVGYAQLIHGSKIQALHQVSLANTSDLCRPPANKDDPAGHDEHRPNCASCAHCAFNSVNFRLFHPVYIVLVVFSSIPAPS